MYTSVNFKTKKALKEAIKKGDKITVFQPGPFGRPSKEYNGSVALEGPHFPAAHTWYASAKVVEGVITKIS